MLHFYVKEIYQFIALGNLKIVNQRLLCFVRALFQYILIAYTKTLNIELREAQAKDERNFYKRCKRE